MYELAPTCLYTQQDLSPFEIQILSSRFRTLLLHPCKLATRPDGYRALMPIVGTLETDALGIPVRLFSRHASEAAGIALAGIPGLRGKVGMPGKVGMLRNLAGRSACLSSSLGWRAW